jgi:hypothetical protein
VPKKPEFAVAEFARIRAQAVPRILANPATLAGCSPWRQARSLMRARRGLKNIEVIGLFVPRRLVCEGEIGASGIVRID